MVPHDPDVHRSDPVHVYGRLEPLGTPTVEFGLTSKFERVTTSGIRRLRLSFFSDEFPAPRATARPARVFVLVGKGYGPVAQLVRARA